MGRNLLDDGTVPICFVRTRQAGWEVRYAEADDMRTIIRDRLRLYGCQHGEADRLPLPPRRFHAALGFDASAWLPGDVMARFFVGC